MTDTIPNVDQKIAARLAQLHPWHIVGEFTNGWPADYDGVPSPPRLPTLEDVLDLIGNCSGVTEAETIDMAIASAGYVIFLRESEEAQEWIIRVLDGLCFSIDSEAPVPPYFGEEFARRLGFRVDVDLGILADYYEEHGDQETAELLRRHWIKECNYFDE